MSQIDWSKAPEWADAHGDVHCITTRNIWFNDNVYMYVGDSRSYKWMDLSTDLIHNHGRRSVTNIQARPVPWTGEGLPPVGTVCEALITSSLGAREWRKCKVIHHCRTSAAVAHGPEFGLVEWGHGFRPIRTPEQIAAEEREKSIKAIADEYLLCKKPGIPAFAEFLYDAGYRKQIDK
jgi:hypothetical protein